MPQYLIPQKTQREDKIIGPLTAKQLLYATGTVVGCFILYSSLNANPFIEFSGMERLLIVAPFVAFGAAFTFLQVNERPFEIFFASFLVYLTAPKVRVWQKELPPLDVSPAVATVKVDNDVPAEAATDLVTRQKIEQLSQMVDKPDTMISASPESAESATSPTSRTLELLKAVEISPGQEKSTSLQIIAKPRKGIGLVLQTLSAMPQKLFGSLFQDSRAPHKKKPTPGKPENSEESTEKIVFMNPQFPKGPPAPPTAPPDINSPISRHSASVTAPVPPKDPLTPDKPL